LPQYEEPIQVGGFSEVIIMPRRTRRRGGREEGQAQPRRVLPEEGKCYEAKTFADPNNFSYLGMYSQDQDRPIGPERQPGGYQWVRGWFTLNGEDERKLYISDTLREVQCRAPNQPRQDDGAMQLDDGGRRRRGRKTRRKTLRQRK
jgi:hypothetical protein